MYDLFFTVRSKLSGAWRKAIIARDMAVASSVFGSNVECPGCNRKFRRFLPFGVKRRGNARCAYCGALERHRLLALYLRREISFGRVLHLAPETSIAKVLKSRSESYISADLGGHADVTCDVQSMPFRDSSFDFIVCSHLLEHVDDDRRAMRELRRVLHPEGKAILLVPIEPGREVTFEDPSVTAREERARVFGQWDHVRIYGSDYYDRLREAGFSVATEDLFASLPPKKLGGTDSCRKSLFVWRALFSLSAA